MTKKSESLKEKMNEVLKRSGRLRNIKKDRLRKFTWNEGDLKFHSTKNKGE
jgi:hypothetical protein